MKGHIFRNKKIRWGSSHTKNDNFKHKQQTSHDDTLNYVSKAIHKFLGPYFTNDMQIDPVTHLKPIHANTISKEHLLNVITIVLENS